MRLFLLGHGISEYIISTDKEIDTADGGFSIEAETCFEVQPGALSGKYRADQIKQDQNSIFACLPWGISGAAALTDGEAKLIDTFPGHSSHNLPAP